MFGYHHVCPNLLPSLSLSLSLSLTHTHTHTHTHVNPLANGNKKSINIDSWFPFLKRYFLDFTHDVAFSISLPNYPESRETPCLITLFLSPLSSPPCHVSSPSNIRLYAQSTPLTCAISSIHFTTKYSLVLPGAC